MPGDLTFLLRSEPLCGIHHRDFRNPRDPLVSTNGVLELLTSESITRGWRRLAPSDYFAGADFAI